DRRKSAVELSKSGAAAVCRQPRNLRQGQSRIPHVRGYRHRLEIALRSYNDRLGCSDFQNQIRSGGIHSLQRRNGTLTMTHLSSHARAALAVAVLAFSIGVQAQTAWAAPPAPQGVPQPKILVIDRKAILE